MTALFVARPARVPARLAYGLAALVVGAGVAGGVVSVLRSGGGPPATGATSPLAGERAALARFEEALEPLMDDGGFTVAMGMRPGVSDIAEGALEDEVLVTMARGWLGSMEQLRDRFASLDVPPFLAEYAEVFDASLDAYVETARALLAAAEATGAERVRLIEEVPPRGRRADELFDRAKAMLEAQRERLAPPSSVPGGG